jgi:hypothetical protein
MPSLLLTGDYSGCDLLDLNQTGNATDLIKMPLLISSLESVAIKNDCIITHQAITPLPPSTCPFHSVEPVCPNDQEI